MSKYKGLDLWDKVSETDPKTTKEVKIGTREFTAIDAYPQFKRATEMFGPRGKGWGIEAFSMWTVPLPAEEIMLLASAVFWWRDDDGKHEESLGSSTFLVRKTSTRGLKADDDAVKKLHTDIATKALSLLGFDADVFLGKFDGNKYVGEESGTYTDKKNYSLEGQGEGVQEIKKKESTGKTLEDRVKAIDKDQDDFFGLQAKILEVNPDGFVEEQKAMWNKKNTSMRRLSLKHLNTESKHANGLHWLVKKFNEDFKKSYQTPTDRPFTAIVRDFNDALLLQHEGDDGKVKDWIAHHTFREGKEDLFDFIKSVGMLEVTEKKWAEYKLKEQEK